MQIQPIDDVGGDGQMECAEAGTLATIWTWLTVDLFVRVQLAVQDRRGALTTSELMVILAITIPVMIVVYGSLGGSWKTEGNTVSNLVTNP